MTRRTVGLGGIPEHDTAKRGVLATGLESEVGKRRRVDIARVRSGRISGGANVDLDVLVDSLRLRPVVPGLEVPVVGVAGVRYFAVVVVCEMYDEYDMTGE